MPKMEVIFLEEGGGVKDETEIFCKLRSGQRKSGINYFTCCSILKSKIE